MLEIPEAFTITAQLNQIIKGKTIRKAVANSSPHGMAFYMGDPGLYTELLKDKRVDLITALAGQIEITAEDTRILFGDGVNIRYVQPDQPLPEKHQLHLELEDGASIIGTIQMYGAIHAFKQGTNDNYYYLVAKEKPSPLSEQFDKEYFMNIYRNSKPNLSTKAFLATEQRIPGLGNGCLQDILFQSRIHPKKKIGLLKEEELDKLFHVVKDVLAVMCNQGGRDTEKDLFGNNGGYRTILSSKTWKEPCPVCGEPIVKQAYLGGNVYYCPTCQQL